MASEKTLFEHSFYIGNIMGAMLYGFELTIYFMILQGLCQRSSDLPAIRGRFCSMYSTAIILLATSNVACNAVWGEKLWITARNAPGGVPGFIETGVSAWYQTLGSTSFVGSVFMGDALLIFRLYIIYGRQAIAIALPTLAYLVAFGLALAQLVISGRPGGNFFGKGAIRISVAYYAITILLNTVVTALICLRLLNASRTIRKALGRESSKTYTGIIAILVESAAPYSVLGIMFLFPYALESQTAIFFGQLWSKMSGIAPLLILLRVVNGSAWRHDMNTHLKTSLVFATTAVDIDVDPSSRTAVAVPAVPNQGR